MWSIEAEPRGGALGVCQALPRGPGEGWGTLGMLQYLGNIRPSEGPWGC